MVVVVLVLVLGVPEADVENDGEEFDLPNAEAIPTPATISTTTAAATPMRRGNFLWVVIFFINTPICCDSEGEGSFADPLEGAEPLEGIGSLEGAGSLEASGSDTTFAPQ